MKFSGTKFTGEAFGSELARLRRVGADGDQTLRRATGTLLRRLPVEARRDMQQQYNLSTRRINFDQSARRAGESAIDLVGRRRKIGLIQYGARWDRRSSGATVAIERGAGRSAWDGGGAFIAVGVSGNKHVFERFGAKRRMQRGRYEGHMRQPISVQHFGSIADLLIDEARVSRLGDLAQAVLAAEIERLLASARR